MLVSERPFREWVGKSASGNDQKPYSAEQFAALSKMSMGMIQELAHPSLLDRFGFGDLASSRQRERLNDLCYLSEVIRAVHEIRKWLPTSILRAPFIGFLPNTPFKRSLSFYVVSAFGSNLCRSVAIKWLRKWGVKPSSLKSSETARGLARGKVPNLFGCLPHCPRHDNRAQAVCRSVCATICWWPGFLGELRCR